MKNLTKVEKYHPLFLPPATKKTLTTRASGEDRRSRGNRVSQSVGQTLPLLTASWNRQTDRMLERKFVQVEPTRTPAYPWKSGRVLLSDTTTYIGKEQVEPRPGCSNDPTPSQVDDMLPNITELRTREPPGGRVGESSNERDSTIPPTSFLTRRHFT